MLEREAPDDTTAEDPPVYTLGSDPAERDRLRRQSQELGHHATALMDHVGLKPGHEAIDLGCGPVGVIELLAERVAPGGRAIGLDANADHCALAQALVDERQLDNVTIVHGDARRTGLPSSSLDLVHARLLLVNVPEPHEIVAEMVRLAKPGGWVACEEVDGLFLCQPPHPAWDRLTEVFLAVYGQDGADIHCGRRVPGLFQDAGLVDVGVEARADVFPIGTAQRFVHLNLVRALRPKILQRGLLDETALDALDRAARHHLDDPATIVLPFIYFLVWGRKP